MLPIIEIATARIIIVIGIQIGNQPINDATKIIKQLATPPITKPTKACPLANPTPKQTANTKNAQNKTNKTFTE
jgi:hypothetical protein